MFTRPSNSLLSALDMVKWRCLICWAVTLFICTQSVTAQTSNTIRWRTGAELASALQAPGGGSWSRIPLRQGLDDLAKIHRVCIILDRRVDPDTLLNYEVQNVSLEVTLRGIASKLQLGTSIGEHYVYLGPATTAKKLRSLIAMQQMALKNLDAERRKPWLTTQTISLTKPTETREIVRSLLIATETKLENAIDLPHDLWDQKQWPSLTRLEVLSLIAIQFDFVWNWDESGQMIKLIPIPEKVNYTVDYATSKATEIQAKLKQLNVQGTITIASNKLTLDSVWEEHRLVTDLLAGKTAKTTQVVEGAQRYTLTAVQPVGKLITALGAKLNLRVEFAQTEIQQANLSLDQEIRLDVKQVTREELLRKVLEPAGLMYELNGEVLLVKPGKK
jgi:hypothetical protein